MRRWLKQLDEILRGESTRELSLQHGQLQMPVAGLCVVILLLGIVSGLCSGSFSLFRALWADGALEPAAMQMIASAVKIPLLFFLTLIVTFPSLYVFGALAGCQMSIGSVWRILLAMLAVMLAVLASLGPIVVFFGSSTESYAFMKLLNVAMATIAGSLGLTFLLRTLDRLVRSSPAAPPTPQPPAKIDAENERHEPIGPLQKTGPTSRRAAFVFRMWVAVFAVVGAQMSWILRPFIGSPHLPFSWFRERKDNFFVDFFRSLDTLLGG